jgi:hypothetical protein
MWLCGLISFHYKRIEGTLHGGGAGKYISNSPFASLTHPLPHHAHPSLDLVLAFGLISPHFFLEYKG